MRFLIGNRLNSLRRTLTSTINKMIMHHIIKRQKKLKVLVFSITNVFILRLCYVSFIAWNKHYPIDGTYFSCLRTYKITLEWMYSVLNLLSYYLHYKAGKILAHLFSGNTWDIFNILFPSERLCFTRMAWTFLIYVNTFR